MKITYLYAIGSWGGPVKFGISLNPWKRTIQIQTAATFKVELIRAEPCSSRAEALLDERFLHDHYTELGASLFGEWFKVTGVQANDAVRDAVSMGAHFRARERAA